MPTLILLDSSLSMLSPIENSEDRDKTESSRKDLAVKGISQFIQLLRETNKHEYVSLATFNDNVKVLQPFTKDSANLLMSCNAIELESKTVLSSAFQYASDECSTVWSSSSFVQILIVTDGLGIELEAGDLDMLPFNFHSFLHIVCLCRKSDCDRSSVEYLESAIRKNNQVDGLYFLEDLSTVGVKRIFSEIVERNYAPTFTVLKCGSFSVPVQLVPPCRTEKITRDFQSEVWSLENKLEIVGFLKPAELCYPPVCSRHLLLPLTNSPEKEETDGGVFKEGEKVANFCVLLHGSMIVSQMTAICELAPGWYGVLYLLPDSKKSNLILNVFEPGTENISWLGNLSQLSVRPCLANETKSPFPVLQKQKPSYSVATPGWLDPASVQSDIQKLLRQARKIPERQPQFYAELNRICRYSLALGFPSVVKKVANLLEREASSATANPQMKKQLNHVSLTLRTKQLKYEETLKPAK